MWTDAMLEIFNSAFEIMDLNDDDLNKALEYLIIRYHSNDLSVVQLSLVLAALVDKYMNS